MEEFRFKNNELWCEDIQVEELARQYGTPLYVYSRNSILDHCRYLERALESVDHLSCYAVKANTNRNILSLLAKENIGADVGSIGELHLALQAGFSPNKITYSGVGKRDDEIEFALRNNILAFNIESEEELAIINDIAKRQSATARICLRVNFDIDAGTHPYITTGKQTNKFGVERSRAKEILQRAHRMSNIEVLGIHSHLGSQIIKAETFVSAAKRIVELVDELRNNSIPVHHLNFGGGFGVQYVDYITHPLLPAEQTTPNQSLTTATLLKEVLPILKKTQCKILIQPGRSIVAHAGILVTKVLYKKVSGGKTFVIVDAGMNDLIRPSLYQSYHQIVPLHLQQSAFQYVDVVGPLCETGDFFATDRQMPEVQRDENLAVLCTGAYGYALSSNYNARPRPAEVLVNGSQSELIRNREVLDNL